jgi:hypothetical protein
MKFLMALFFFSLVVEAQAFQTPLNNKWKIEVLITSPSLKGLESLFGHSAILVIPDGKNIEEGFVWEFQANIMSSDKNKWWDVAEGGLTGKFPFIVTKEPALIFFSRHIVYELRSIKRVIVPTTSQQSAKIVHLLESLEKDPSSLNQYFFRTENCMTALLRVFKLSGLPINLNQLLSQAKKSGMIPSRLPIIFRQLLISYFPPQTSFNLMVQVKDIEKKYNVSLTSKVQGGRFLEWESFEKENFKKFQNHELALAAHSLNIYDDQRLPFLQKMISSAKSQNYSLVEMKNFPDILYQTCEDSACVNDAVRASSEILDKKDYQLLKAALFNEYNRTKQLFLPEINVLESPQAISWKNIMNSFMKIH